MIFIRLGVRKIKTKIVISANERESQRKYSQSFIENFCDGTGDSPVDRS